MIRVLSFFLRLSKIKLVIRASAGATDVFKQVGTLKRDDWGL